MHLSPAFINQHRAILGALHSELERKSLNKSKLMRMAVESNDDWKQCPFGFKHFYLYYSYFAVIDLFQMGFLK